VQEEHAIRPTLGFRYYAKVNESLHGRSQKLCKELEARKATNFGIRGRRLILELMHTSAPFLPLSSPVFMLQRGVTSFLPHHTPATRERDVADAASSQISSRLAMVPSHLLAPLCVSQLLHAHFLEHNKYSTDKMFTQLQKQGSVRMSQVSGSKFRGGAVGTH
jgi:hypothetical protein